MKKIKDENERAKRRKEAVSRAVNTFYSDKKRVYTVFTQEEYTLLEKAAKKKEVSVTRYVRDAALDKAKKTKH